MRRYDPCDETSHVTQDQGLASHHVTYCHNCHVVSNISPTETMSEYFNLFLFTLCTVTKTFSTGCLQQCKSFRYTNFFEDLFVKFIAMNADSLPFIEAILVQQK